MYLKQLHHSPRHVGKPLWWRYAEREHLSYAAARNAAIRGVVPGPDGGVGGDGSWQWPFVTRTCSAVASGTWCTRGGAMMTDGRGGRLRRRPGAPLVHVPAYRPREQQREATAVRLPRRRGWEPPVIRRCSGWLSRILGRGMSVMKDLWREMKKEIIYYLLQCEVSATNNVNIFITMVICILLVHILHDCVLFKIYKICICYNTQNNSPIMSFTLNVIYGVSFSVLCLVFLMSLGWSSYTMAWWRLLVSGFRWSCLVGSGILSNDNFPIWPKFIAWNALILFNMQDHR